MLEEKWVSWTMQTSKKWSDIEEVLKYTKIDFIDYDHKILVEYALKVNQLIDKSEKEFSLELLEDISLMLNELYEYAVEHFDREEVFMEEYNLPRVENHKREHKEILSILKHSIDDFNLGKAKVSHKLKIQIMDWLIQHINKVDFDFFDINNWSNNLVNASDWKAVSQIVSLTGINEIDLQHKKLTEMAIDIMTEIDEFTSEEVLQKLFDKFKNYVVYHFDYESNFMKKYNIEDSNDHFNQHDYFIKRIEEFPNEILLDSSKIDELKIWILTWWINHINVTDYDTFNYNIWVYPVIEKAEDVSEISELLRLTGIATIDYDHIEVMKKTFELNKKIELSIENKNLNDKSIKEEIVSMLKVIYGMADYHFKREEVIMKKYQLKDSLSHSIEHNQILEKVMEMLKNYEEDRLYASKNIKTIILDWWIHHTNNIDYRTFVLNVDDDKLELIRREERNGERI